MRGGSVVGARSGLVARPTTLTRSLYRVAFAAGLALAVALPVWADFAGKVIGVGDGDSITVLKGREQVRVRLVDIDAPRQKFTVIVEDDGNSKVTVWNK